MPPGLETAAIGGCIADIYSWFTQGFDTTESQGARALLREAEPLAKALGDQRRLGWLSVYLVEHFIQAGDQERAVVCGQRALSIGTACGELALQVMANFFLSIVYATWGDYRRAIARDNRARARARWSF